MECEVVRLRGEHLASAAELERECFAEPWTRDALELLLGERGVGFAVLDGERVVAYVGMICVLDEGQITNVAVSSAFRRRGIGRALMLALENYCKESGIVMLSLEVRESNTAARALYGSLGWREEGLRKGFYRLPTENAIVMTKSL